MHFHPADTCNLYEGLDKDLVDQLWYRVHYFQQKSLKRDSKNRLEPLYRELKLNNSSRIFIEKRLKQRQAALLSGLQYTHALKVMNGKLNGKLMHGMGGANVRDASLTLHPLYGTPYIPGSSIKGVVRNWVIQAFFEGQEKELKDEKDSDQEKNELRTIFRDIFGSEERAGQIEFFDAFVDVGFSLLPDVLTVHFPDYYKGNIPPGDNQSPKPINFYAISCQSVQFIVGIRRDATPSLGYTLDVLLKLALAWLKKALTELGIGSKSSAGYGYFAEFEDKFPVKEEPTVDFSPTQKLVFKIEHFTDKDLSRSKDKLVFDRVVEFAEQGDKEPALALKTFWEKNGAWKAKEINEKQKLKVARIKQLLEG